MRVLIVDDEKIVRIALKSIVDWDALGCTVCGVAANAADALELIVSERPHLVITDIVMPKMDGIELIRAARDGGYRGEFVILTNHQDFQYAQEAIHHGVLEYVIKTDISADTLMDTINKARRAVEPLLAEESPAPGVHPNDVDHIKRLLRDPSHTFTLSEPHYFVLVFVPSATLPVAPLEAGGMEAGAAAITSSPAGVFHSVVEEAAGELSGGIVDVSRDHLVIAVPRSYGCGPVQHHSRLFSGVRTLVQLYMNSPCGFVVSAVCSTSAEFSRSLRRCIIAASAGLYDGLDAPIPEHRAETITTNHPDAPKVYRTLTHHLNQCAFDEARTFLRDVTTRCREGSYDPQLVARMYRAIHRLLHMDYGVWAMADERPGERPLSTDRPRVVEPYAAPPDVAPPDVTADRPLAAVTLDDYHAAVHATIAAIEAGRVHCEAGAVRSEVLRIITFVQQHIEEKISLAVLAENVNMTEGYVGRLFKAETGMNITRFINLSKLERAKELLLEKDHPVKYVAFAVGFDSPSYFNRLFNQIYGINPTDYVRMVRALGSVDESVDRV